MLATTMLSGACGCGDESRVDVATHAGTTLEGMTTAVGARLEEGDFRLDGAASGGAVAAATMLMEPPRGVPPHPPRL